MSPPFSIYVPTICDSPKGTVVSHDCSSPIELFG